MTAGIGDKQDLVFPVFTYTNVESTLAACGPIEYEIIGGPTAYLTIDAATRTLTYNP